MSVQLWTHNQSSQSSHYRHLHPISQETQDDEFANCGKNLGKHLQTHSPCQSISIPPWTYLERISFCRLMTDPEYSPWLCKTCLVPQIETVRKSKESTQRPTQTWTRSIIARLRIWVSVSIFGVRCTRSTLISGTAAPLVLIVFDMPNAKSTRRRHKIHDSNELTLPSSPRRSRWDLLVWFG